MFSIPLLLLLQSLFWSLRLGTSGGSFPKALNTADETRLLTAAAEGDKAARDKLIEHNLRLVAHICKKYFSKAEHDDLISIGTIGLIKAIDTYKINRSTKLATYAARCIENEILMQFRKEKKGQSDVSLNNLLETDSDDGGLSLLDTLASDHDLLEEYSLKEDCAKLRALVNTVLDKREALIIISRYGLDNAPPLTQSEVAGTLGISRSYVSRLEKRAVEKLREFFA